MAMTIDQLLGVRSYRVYWCQLCADTHVEGLDRLFVEHFRHIIPADCDIDSYRSTMIADYRQERHREGLESDG